MIAPPEPVWVVRDLERPELTPAWVVHSHFGLAALAMPVYPIEDEAAPVAPGTASDPTEGITS